MFVRRKHSMPKKQGTDTKPTKQKDISPNTLFADESGVFYLADEGQAWICASYGGKFPGADVDMAGIFEAFGARTFRAR